MPKHSTPRRASGQLPAPDAAVLGACFARRWIDHAERFASALYWAIAFPSVSSSRDAAADARSQGLSLTPADFPSSEHWTIVALLCAFAERAVRPTAERILCAARLGGLTLPLGGGHELAELAGLLIREASAEGLSHFGVELKRLARLARQSTRLFGRLQRYMAGDRGVTSSPVPIVSRRIYRKGVSVC